MSRQYLTGDVLAAMERREIKVFYQPKYDATTNRLKSAEALARWVRKDGSIVLPERFLTAMEQSDVITVMTILPKRDALPPAASMI